jgi:universal stress protein A
MAFYRHILLTTDLSEHSKQTAFKALQLAEVYGARITLLHVIEPLPGYAMGSMPVVDLEKEMFDQAKMYMMDLAKELVIPETDQKIEVGSVKACILKAANDLNVDLIIMGSHGRHGLEHLLGSTAAAVLNSAQCDVLVVRNA